MISRRSEDKAMISTMMPIHERLAEPIRSCTLHRPCAKWWWGASLTLKALGFATGALIFLPVAQEPLPFLVAAGTILAELTICRSDALKGVVRECGASSTSKIPLVGKSPTPSPPT